MQRASLPDCILKTQSRIDLLPSNLKTANLDVELLGVIKFHERLSDALSDVPEGAYDYVILDCPPNLSMNTLNAFGAASVVVIPVEVKQEAFDVVSHLMNTLLKVTGGKATIRPYGLPTKVSRLITQRLLILAFFNILAGQCGRLCSTNCSCSSLRR